MQIYNSEFDADVIDFLKIALTFNPTKRASVDQLLNHSIFKDIRVPANEVSASKRIDIKVDHMHIDEIYGEPIEFSISRLK